MRIESPVSHLERADSNDSEILVNVFNGSEKTIVRYRIDEDNWQEMKRMETAYSPHFQELFADYPSSATPTNHIWSSPLPKLDSGTYLDRKSTRLNSSHVAISYAVFCLK